ncbi:peroxiredoxin family protein [Polaribacter sp. OB-PA-B3]
MHKRFLHFILFLSICVSCNKPKVKTLKKGTYRAILKVKDNQKLPFIMDVKSDSLLSVYNAEEEIIVDEISYVNDSVLIKMPVYEGYIMAKIKKNGLLQGSFIKESLDRTVPFYTEAFNKRFIKTKKTNVDVSGNWEVIFSQNSKEDKYIAKGIFKQKKSSVTGTFRTTTGDYRYLEGIINGDSLKLSTFDGAHAFLFTAKVTDSIMNGYFYSGNHWKETFTAKLNNSYELPNEEELTFLNPEYESFDFSFSDENGKIISLSDKEYQNEVVLVQIMGTWCPNCLDESKFYVNYLNNNPNKKIKIVALAFEVAKNKDAAFKRIKRLKNRIGINYPVLLADFGNVANKTMAQKKLPMLNHILSYPTTIFIDKKGKVRKIHTGFNGPATGKNYIDFKKDFEVFIDLLVNEK